VSTVVQRLLDDDLVQEELDERRLKMRKVEQAKAGQDARYTEVVVCTPDISINNQLINQPQQH